MKRIVISFLLCGILIPFAYSQNEENEQAKRDFAVVSVKWEHIVKINKLCLLRMVEGNLDEVATYSQTDDNMFYFACRPEPEGFYYISINAVTLNRYPVYLKKGDRVELTITLDSWYFTGNISAENMELKKWHDFIQPIEQKAVYHQRFPSTFNDFFPLLEEKYGELPKYLSSGTGNKSFDKKFETYKKNEFASLALAYIFTPRTVHPKAGDFPNYYDQLNVSDFVQTAALIDYPGGLNIVDRIIFVKGMSSGESTGDPSKIILENLDTMIANDTIKGELMLKYATIRRTYVGLLDYHTTYGKYLITEKQQNKFQDMLNDLSDAKDNTPAIDFGFPDINGKQVSLSDFKGKVVYIDVWATWCGPCKQEIPYLKELEEEYNDNPNIVFLSVSVDAQKDFEKWKKYIADENLKGVQLFAGDKAKSELMTPYKIGGIPRFMLIGKNGNLISIDAPRPSSQEIHSVLKALLK